MIETCGTDSKTKEDLGSFGTVARGIENMSIPDIKKSRPYKTYEGRLGLGDFEKYPETALYIDVIRYFKTKRLMPPSAKSYVTQSSAVNGSTQSSHTIDGDVEMTEQPSDLSNVKTTRHYQVNDASQPGGKRSVEREDLSKGYEYGRTAVHINQIEENVTQYETIQGFSIIGFIPMDKVR